MDNKAKDTKETHFLCGKLLLAMPSMGDPRFHQAVILLCAHDENGAMGLVINHAFPDLAFPELLKQLKLTSDIKIDLDKLSLPVMYGGPVETARGFLLHSSDFKQIDTVPIDEHFHITGTLDALREVALGNGPEDMIFILGYAGWGAGQLDHEMQQNAWLVVDPDPDLIFNAAPDKKWNMAIEKLGINPDFLSTEAGQA